MYIAFEGIDTCGKSTQIELLKTCYPQAIFTKEPGGSLIGKQIRSMLLNRSFVDAKNLDEVGECFSCTDSLDAKTEFLLFLADRAEHTAKVIAPNHNKLIISDRSLISGIAYAVGILQAKPFNLFATNKIIPDMVILLKIDENVLHERLSQKPQDFIESRGISYLLEIQERLEGTTRDLGCKFEVLDAKRSIESLHTQIKQVIDEMCYLF